MSGVYWNKKQPNSHYELILVHSGYWFKITKEESRVDICKGRDGLLESIYDLVAPEYITKWDEDDRIVLDNQ